MIDQTNKASKTKILIKLDWDLEIYEFGDSKNLESKISIFSLKRSESRVLNLSQKFEEIWKWLDIRYDINEIYYLIGDKASFSDSRMIYIWLKSWQMFNPDCNFFVSYLDQNQGDDQDINNWVINPIQLKYLHEVRIGGVDCT